MLHLASAYGNSRLVFHPTASIAMLHFYSCKFIFYTLKCSRPYSLYFCKIVLGILEECEAVSIGERYLSITP
jgi:hypothetical protein